MCTYNDRFSQTGKLCRSSFGQQHADGLSPVNQEHDAWNKREAWGKKKLFLFYMHDQVANAILRVNDII